MAIAEMAEMAILAVMATIVMANGNFSMGIKGIELKGTKKTSSVMIFSFQ